MKAQNVLKKYTYAIGWVVSLQRAFMINGPEIKVKSQTCPSLQIFGKTQTGVFLISRFFVNSL